MNKQKPVVKPQVEPQVQPKVEPQVLPQEACPMDPQVRASIIRQHGYCKGCGDSPPDGI